MLSGCYSTSSAERQSPSQEHLPPKPFIVCSHKRNKSESAIMHTQKSNLKELEALPSDLKYDECVHRLALLVQRKDSKTLEETAHLMGQLISAIE
jgi:hypothetical protein